MQIFCKTFKFRIPKNCVLCESWILFNAPLCRFCRKYLYKEFCKNKNDVVYIEGIPCSYLWAWTYKNHVWIQKIVLLMKDGNNFELYKLLMPWLLRKMQINLINFKKSDFVLAVPSFDRQHPEALVKVYQKFNPTAKIIKIYKKDVSSQKYKSKSERLRVKFGFSSNKNEFSNWHRGITILDDVLATGGSFRGALELLGPENILCFAVWAYKIQKFDSNLKQFEH